MLVRGCIFHELRQLGFTSLFCAHHSGAALSRRITLNLITLGAKNCLQEFPTGARFHGSICNYDECHGCFSRNKVCHAHANEVCRCPEGHKLKTYGKPTADFWHSICFCSVYVPDSRLIFWLRLGFCST